MQAREGTEHADCTKVGLSLPVMKFVHPLFGKIISEIFHNSTGNANCMILGVLLREPFQDEWHEIRDCVSVICDPLNVVVRPSFVFDCLIK